MTNTFIYSFIGSIVVGASAGYLGSLMISKKMALVGDAMGHIALPGIGLALVYGFNPSLGAFVFLLFGIFLILFFERKTSLSLETLVGIVFVSSLAIGFLIVPSYELEHALIGDISQLYFKTAIITSFLSFLVLFLVKKIYSPMALIMISEDVAKSRGINVFRYHLVYLFAIAIVVALGIEVVGSLLVGALMIIPPAIARNLSKSLSAYQLLSIFFGVLGSVLGLIVFFFTGLPAGPLIILCSACLFLVSTFFKQS